MIGPGDLIRFPADVVGGVRRIVDERRDDLVRALHCQVDGPNGDGRGALLGAGPQHAG